MSRLTIAAAAAVLLTAAQARADRPGNGGSINTVSTNGLTGNGLNANGLSLADLDSVRVEAVTLPSVPR